MLEDLFKEGKWIILEDWDDFEVEDIVEVLKGDKYEADI
jgi:hypothetical protein